MPKTSEVFSSATWAARKGVRILDPNGWNQADYDNSWYELINEQEFDRRVGLSTFELRKK